MSFIFCATFFFFAQSENPKCRYLLRSVPRNNSSYAFYQFMLFVIQGYATKILKNIKKKMQREKLVKLYKTLIISSNI